MLGLEGGCSGRRRKGDLGMPDMDQIKGKAREGMGSVQEKAGEMTGDRDMEARGSEQKSEGKLEGAWGKAKDSARDAADAMKDKVGH
jgi:uncharacterized protein YjbJ (UPF0337 family)